MSSCRSRRVIAVSLAALSAVALTSVWALRQFTGTKWPAGSDEERLAQGDAAVRSMVPQRPDHPTNETL